MPKEYLDKIRAKYPQYADIPDTTLAQQIIAKHPEYQDILGDMVHATPVAQSAPTNQAEPSYGQRIENQVNAAGNRLAGVGDVYARNKLAGIAELGDATLQAAMTLAAPITEAPGIGAVAKPIGEGFQWAGKKIFHGLVDAGVTAGRNAAIPEFLQAVLPKSAYGAPQDRQEAFDKWNQLGSDATGLALGIGTGELATKGISAGAKAIAAPFTAEGKQVAGDLAFKKANPPRANELNYDEQFQKAKPYFAEQLQKTPLDVAGDLTPHEQGLQVGTQAKQGVFDKYNPIIQNHPEVRLSGDDVASSVSDGISRYLKNIEPKRAAQIQEYANRYSGRDITLPEANDYLTGLNAELNDYYKQPATVRAQMDATGVPIAAKAAAADALRSQMIKGLENVGESSVEGLRNDYGAVSQMTEAIRRNIVKADKPQPSFLQKFERGGRPLWMTMLAEGVGTAAGLPQGMSIPLSLGASYLADRMGRMQLPTNQMRSALEKMGQSGLTPPDITSVRPRVAGLLPQASYRMGGPTEGSINVTTGQVETPMPQGNLPPGVKGLLPFPRTMGMGPEAEANAANVTTGTYPPQEVLYGGPQRPVQGPQLNVPTGKPPWLRGGGGGGPDEIATMNVKNAGMRLDGIVTQGGKRLVYFSDDNPTSPTYKDTFTRPIEDVLDPNNISAMLKAKAATRGK